MSNDFFTEFPDPEIEENQKTKKIGRNASAGMFENDGYTFVHLNPPDPPYDYWIDLINENPNKKYVLYDLTDNNHLHPYDFTFVDRKFEQRDVSNEQYLMNFCYLYVLLKNFSCKTLENIILITTDVNFDVNLENVQLSMLNDGEIDEAKSMVRIKHFLWYWTFLHTLYDTRFDIRPEFLDIEKKYNVIYPLFGRRLGRLHMMSELHTHENLAWSNIGHLSNEGQMRLDKGIENLTFYRGNYYNFNKVIYQTPDFPCHHYFLLRKGFHSHERRLMTEDKNYFIGHKEKDLDNSDWQYRVSKEFLESSMYLFWESYIHLSTHPTEKTWKGFIHRKPFLAMSGPHLFRFLKKLGFKMYTELFDYEFDSKNYETRFNSVLDQTKKYLDMDKDKLQDLLKSDKIVEKLEYNRNLALSIAKKLLPLRYITDFDTKLLRNL